MPSLAPGTRLGPYEVTAHVGDGGMGEVYRARDTRLDRIVAIKVSKESFSERFDREARAVATLNHPHICTLFDVGPDYLVMEYVEGSPLKGPLPLDRALTYGAQICEALDAAHRKGITHRDLKPANILVTKAGVKLLDFGLAKIEPAVVTDEAAMTRAVTQQGQILGTLHYMSPEQLQGQETGPASDIFSFGLVLYEMITGKRAFDGASPASVIAAILERPAPSIADVAPPALDRTLRRCLEKDPERRWQNARDVRLELEWIASGGGLASASDTPRSSHRMWPWLAAVATLTVALGAALWAPWRTSPRPPAFTFTVDPPARVRFTGGPMVSPDGTRIATLSVADDGKRAIHVLRLDTGTWLQIPGSENGGMVSWSTDNRFLAFVDGVKIKRIDINGGPPTEVADFPPGNLPPFTAWNPDGLILFAGLDGLYVTPASGGTRRRVTTGGGAVVSQFLPDGRHFIYWKGNAGPNRGTVYAGSIDTPPDQNAHEVMNGTSLAIFARDLGGRELLLFVREEALMAQRFDTSGLRLVGDSFLVASQVGMMGPVPGVSVSNSGVLAYSTAAGTNGRFAWFDRHGTHLSDVGPPGTYYDSALAPDDSRIALSQTSDRGVTTIELLDSKGSELNPITYDHASNRSPVFSADGTRLAYLKRPSGIFEKQVSGAGPERRLVEGGSSFPTDWSSDGTLVYTSGGDIWFLKDGKPLRFRETSHTEDSAHLSPDGRAIAYTSDDSTRVLSVYVESVPSGNIWRVFDDAIQPRWRRDGRELFFIRFSDGKLMAAPVTAGANLSFGTPVELFSIPRIGTQRGYNVASDGERFLIPTPTAPGAPAPITVTTNWTPAP